MAAPMGQMSGMGMQNMGNMGGLPSPMTPQQQQQQMMHSQQHPGMQQQFHPQQHQQMGMGPSPQQQMMMQQQHQQQMAGPQQQQLHPMQQQTMMQGQGMPQIRQPTPQQGQQAPSPQPEMTPVHQAKLLVPQLKEALTNLMKASAQNIYQNGLVDACLRSVENPPHRLDIYLEEFYSVCDQIELNLRLAIECNNANADSLKHTPFPVQAARQEPTSAEAQSYAQFLSLARLQIQQAQDVRDLLLEGARKIGERPHPP